jgi:hypothetical protein
MTTHFRRMGVKMSRCRRCDHDLEPQKDGSIRCTNGRCKWSKSPYRMGHTLNVKQPIA